MANQHTSASGLPGLPTPIDRPDLMQGSAVNHRSYYQGPCDTPQHVTYHRLCGTPQQVTGHMTPCNDLSLLSQMLHAMEPCVNSTGTKLAAEGPDGAGSCPATPAVSLNQPLVSNTQLGCRSGTTEVGCS